jgi:hypothetical protein
MKAIISQMESNITTNMVVFIPDENSILRESKYILVQLHAILAVDECVTVHAQYNDDNWLRGRLDMNIVNNQYCLYVLHPLINMDIASMLNIPTIRFHNYKFIIIYVIFNLLKRYFY